MTDSMTLIPGQLGLVLKSCLHANEDNLMSITPHRRGSEAFYLLAVAGTFCCSVSVEFLRLHVLEPEEEKKKRGKKRTAFS